jgi:hypothetical protein
MNEILTMGLQTFTNVSATPMDIVTIKQWFNSEHALKLLFPASVDNVTSIYS